MIKWEYAALLDQSIHDQDGWKHALSFWGPDGKEQKLQSSDLVVTLNQLGSVGWELVEISVQIVHLFSDKLQSGIPYQGADPLRRSFWLKRPIS